MGPGRPGAAGRLGALVVLLRLGGAVAGEEEPAVSPVNVGISVMLLGSICFMMALFELTHCYKVIMAKYTWKAISATISIFSAVLLFQGVNGLVEAYILEGASEGMELLVNVLHALLWFAMLQLALAIISGVMPMKCFDPKLDNIPIMESRLKTFAILLGHITGFAAINALACFQQLVPRSFITTFLVCPFGWLIIYVLGRLTDNARERAALIGDNQKSKNEEMWDEETEETEDDVTGLAVSFCFVQSLRFLIGGFLPNSEGEEPDAVATSHSFWQCCLLLGMALCVAAVEVCRVIYYPDVNFQRITPQGKNITAMSFSWALYFSVDWYISGAIFVNEQGMMKEVCLALTVTVVALMMIFILEQLQALKATDDKMDEAIRAIINAIGILIGFAWERSFDVAVAEITEETTTIPRPMTKVLLSLLLASTVVPAWYRHIMPTILLYEAEEEAEEGNAEAIENVEKLKISSGSRLTKGLSGLGKPLLAPAGSNSDLEAQCEHYRRQVTDLEKNASRAQELEQKNKELEVSLSNISKELSDLQKLADQLNG